MADNSRRNGFLETGDGKNTYTIPDVSDETRPFSINGSGKEPAEIPEMRGAVKEYTAGSVIWRIVRPFLILIASAALVIFLGITVYNYVKGNYFDPVSASPAPYKTVQIKPGSSLSTIASTLYEEGIVRNKFVFQMYVDFKDLGGSMQAGTYKFTPAMTMDEIIVMLVAGDGGKKTAKVTLTEGMTAEDMADALVSKEVFDATERLEFLELCGDIDTFDTYDFVRAVTGTEDYGQRDYILEGYLFPDTYEFYLEATPEEVVNRLLGRFDQIFTVDYEDRANELGLTVDQIMTLASIIEKESLTQDFKKVSAVFHNRLTEEMPMQSDATVGYALGKKPPYTLDELETDSPYNTFVVPALPIGPIANPGKKAIEAALYPDEEYIEELYLYFCNKDPDSGELAFSKTLDEHEEKVEAYNDLVAAKEAAAETPEQ